MSQVILISFLVVVQVKGPSVHAAHTANCLPTHIWTLGTTLLLDPAGSSRCLLLRACQSGCWEAKGPHQASFWIRAFAFYSRFLTFFVLPLRFQVLLPLGEKSVGEYSNLAICWTGLQWRENSSKCRQQRKRPGCQPNLFCSNIWHRDQIWASPWIHKYW